MDVDPPSDRSLARLFKNLVEKVRETGVIKKIQPQLTALHCNAPILPEFYAGKSLYEIYPRSFSRQGTFKALYNSLDKLQNLGIDFIWLMPIYPIGKKNKKGSLGCPYAVRDYYSVEPSLGTMNDFLRFVEEVHRRDMRIILDLVVNHVAPDYTGFVQQPEMALRDNKNRITRKVAAWSDVVDLDYRNSETRDHVRGIMAFWMKQGIDGFRCDVAGLVPIQFWEDAVDELKQYYPEIFMLAEWQGQTLHRTAFNSSYDWVLYEWMKKVKKGASIKRLTEWTRVWQQVNAKGAKALRFLENHDLPRAVKTFGKRGFVPYLVFIYCMPGLPLIYNGQETGAQKQLSLFDPDPLIEDSPNQQIIDIYSRLIFLRKNILALCDENFIIHSSNCSDDVLILRKKNMFIILNFRAGKKRIQLTVDLAHTLNTGMVLFNNYKDLQLSGSQLMLRSFQSIIVRMKNHEQQDRIKV